MAKILTGIQSTGTPHLGNILGAIIPAIDMANSSNEESYLFIANMHSLTQIKDLNILKENTFSTAATWLSFGLDPKKSCFFRQSDVPEVTELAWYLSCFFPYQRLKLAHSFKDKADNLKDVNSGLFSYPMLMSADILMYDANIVPVGKDQLQHLEMTRDVATRFQQKGLIPYGPFVYNGTNCSRFVASVMRSASSKFIKNARLKFPFCISPSPKRNVGIANANFYKVKENIVKKINRSILGSYFKSIERS